MNAIIAGAGIGGLTAAIALRRAGIDAQVHERAPEPREVGAGISLWANAVSALDAIGVADDVVRAGDPLVRGHLRTHTDRRLAEQAADTRARFGYPSILIHRAELVEALLRHLPKSAVHFNHPIASYTEYDTGVTARFADGSSAFADVLIGADGVRSVVRRQLLDDGDPRYAGSTAYRGVVPFPLERWPAGHAMEVWGPRARFGITRLPRERLYWWATHASPPLDGVRTPPAEMKATLVGRFAAFQPLVRDLIAATPAEAILRNDLLDRSPAPRWSSERVTLLGDAAHPTTPNLGQGGCMAIEDGVVLARELKAALDTDRDIERALRRYERARTARTAGVTRESARFGVMGEIANPVARAARDAATIAAGRLIGMRTVWRYVTPVVGPA